MDALSVINVTRLVEEITLPSTPPAAVTNKIGPTVFNVSFVKSYNLSVMLDCAIKTIPRITPTARATIGVPRNAHAVFSAPPHPRIEDTLDIAIKIIGIMIGARLINPLGSLP